MGGARTTLRGDTYSVLPLLFKSIFELSDLLFKALNPSRELGRCQVLPLVIIGPERGAPAPVRDIEWGIHCLHRGLGVGMQHGGMGSQQSPSSPIKGSVLPVHFVTLSSLCPTYQRVPVSLAHIYN